FDCLAFDRRLRLVDPVDEVSFLAMECGELGAAWAQDVLFAACAGRVPLWRAPPRLVAFYKAVHALTRARLAVLHLEDLAVRHTAAWRDETRRRIALAERFAMESVMQPLTS
ncbi:MAG: hypothetical protein D6782_10785, partial [Alphaproteobacteria bacterium]